MRYASDRVVIDVQCNAYPRQSIFDIRAGHFNPLTAAAFFVLIHQTNGSRERKKKEHRKLN